MTSASSSSCSSSSHLETYIFKKPFGKVRFSSPQAEKKYRKIMRQHSKRNPPPPRPSLMDVPLFFDGTDPPRPPYVRRRPRPLSAKCFTGPNAWKRGRVITSRKFEDPFIAALGPIPSPGSDLFANMSIILCDGRQSERCIFENQNNKENGGVEKKELYYSEDRLALQIKRGGGKVYKSLYLVPTAEQENIRLVTNVPSLHPQRVLCFKAGIPAYSHSWIIRCCTENKPLKPTQDDIDAVNFKDCECCHCSQLRPEPKQTDTIDSEPMDAIESEPIAMIEPEPLTMIEPEPLAMIDSESLAMMESEPLALIGSESLAMMESEPPTLIGSESLAMIESEPLAMIESESLTIIELEPLTKIEIEPLAIIGSEPPAIIESEPPAMIESEPLAMMETEPLAMIETEGQSRSR